MWERIATTQGQDRVLHGAAKLANVIIGLIALPLFLLGQRIGGWARQMLSRDPGAAPELPVPPPGERTMTALVADLEAIPGDVRPSRTAELRKYLPDAAPFILAQHRETGVLGYAYPSQFVEERFRSADGEPIAASVAVHRTGPRPGLVVVHGTFSSRRFDYVRQIAVRAFYEWGFNVAAIDLRSFGLTELLTDAPNSGGWKEGEDVIAAAEYLRGQGTTTVGAIGISLGASAVLGACHLENAHQALAGGIIAISGPADVRKAAFRVSERVPRNHPRYPITVGFRSGLTARIRAGRWPDHLERLDQYLEEVAAPWYGVTGEELMRRSSALHHIADARVPLLVLHPEDDHIVKVEHARMLAEAARDNELVHVWTVAGGGHGALDIVDRDWTYAVYRTFFERWAEYPSRATPEPAYSGNGRSAVGMDG